MNEKKVRGVVLIIAVALLLVIFIKPMITRSLDPGGIIPYIMLLHPVLIILGATLVNSKTPLRNALWWGAGWFITLLIRTDFVRQVMSGNNNPPLIIAVTIMIMNLFGSLALGALLRFVIIMLRFILKK